MWCVPPSCHRSKVSLLLTGTSLRVCAKGRFGAKSSTPKPEHNFPTSSYWYWSRRRPDNVPSASCVRRVGPVWSQANLEPLYGYRCLSKLHRVAQAIGQAAINRGYRVFYRETHRLLDDLAEATIDGTRKECMELFVSVPLLIIDDLGMRKLPMTAAEDLLEIVMRAL